MTVQEFSDELDVIYENINKNGAPGLDGYEKSVILSHAQELLVKQYIQREPGADRFPELIKAFDNATLLPGEHRSNAYIANLPTGYLKILNEYLLDAGGVSHVVLTLDPETFQQKMSKAYTYPSRRRAWKLSQLNSAGPAGAVELYVRPGFIPTNYRCRYVSKPTPIILEDISPNTIDGISAVTECALEEGLHRDILILATSLAEQYYMDKYDTSGDK
jgi:hypothetical protein